MKKVSIKYDNYFRDYHRDRVDVNQVDWRLSAVVVESSLGDHSGKGVRLKNKGVCNILLKANTFIGRYGGADAKFVLATNEMDVEYILGVIIDGTQHHIDGKGHWTGTMNHQWKNNANIQLTENGGVETTQDIMIPAKGLSVELFVDYGTQYWVHHLFEVDPDQLTDKEANLAKKAVKAILPNVGVDMNRKTDDFAKAVWTKEVWKDWHENKQYHPTIKLLEHPLYSKFMESKSSSSSRKKNRSSRSKSSSSSTNSSTSSSNYKSKNTGDSMEDGMLIDPNDPNLSDYNSDLSEDSWGMSQGELENNIKHQLWEVQVTDYVLHAVNAYRRPTKTKKDTSRVPEFVIVLGQNKGSVHWHGHFFDLKENRVASIGIGGRLHRMTEVVLKFMMAIHDYTPALATNVTPTLQPQETDECGSRLVAYAVHFCSRQEFVETEYLASVKKIHNNINNKRKRSSSNQL
jgi:hypothetical protein